MPVTQTREHPSKVLATATEENALAVATATAGNLSKYYITGVDAFYDDSDVTGTLQIKQGSTVVWEAQIHGQANINFTSALEFDPETSVSAELAAGGTAVNGVVNLRGYLAY